MQVHDPGAGVIMRLTLWCPFDGVWTAFEQVPIEHALTNSNYNSDDPGPDKQLPIIEL